MVGNSEHLLLIHIQMFDSSIYEESDNVTEEMIAHVYGTRKHLNHIRIQKTCSFLTSCFSVNTQNKAVMSYI